DRIPVTLLTTGDRPAALAGRLAVLVRGAGAVPVVLRMEALEESLVAAVLLLAVIRDVVPVLWNTEYRDHGLELLVPELPIPLVMAPPTAGVTPRPAPAGA